LIGGATTSRQHTAVKIAPEYTGAALHVLDASRAVGVVAALLDDKRRERFVAEARADQDRLRGLYAGGQGRRLLAYPQARERRPRIEWSAADVAKPAFVGRRTLEDYPLDEIAGYIDWTFFFSAWELKGRFPKIFEHPAYGKAARELYDNGRELLERMLRERQLRANAVYGFWPAASDGDDIVLYRDESRGEELLRFGMLRQQSDRSANEPCLCLADFVAPAGSGVDDYVGAFAVTTGLGADELAKRYEAEHDDYNAIMVKALADRLAEAFTELLHERARREWYAAAEKLAVGELIAEKFRGIRPAFGYPACPDHSEKVKLFELLDAPAVGIHLTESCAMLPPASVSGIYLGHAKAQYFNLGRIGRDQVEAYAARKGMPVRDVEKWLGSNLGYEPPA
jgi:5-methyltetrahydrofolate--homocysteine methyltransferase